MKLQNFLLIIAFVFAGSINDLFGQADFFWSTVDGTPENADFTATFTLQELSTWRSQCFATMSFSFSLTFDDSGRTSQTIYTEGGLTKAFYVPRTTPVAPATLRKPGGPITVPVPVFTPRVPDQSVLPIFKRFLSLRSVKKVAIISQ